MKNKYVNTPFLYVTLASFLFIGNGYAGATETNLGAAVEIYATDLPTYKPLNSFGSFIMRMDQKSKLTESEFLAKANEFFGLHETNTFALRNSYTDAYGIVHNTYQHYVGNYPVQGQMFIVHNKNGKVTAVNGTIVNIENKKSVYSLRANVNRKPAISSTQAVSIAYKANQITTDPDTVENYPIETVFALSAKEEGLFVLSYKVRVDEISSKRVMSKNVFVSVENGEVINEISLIAHANIPGVGDGYYRSNLPLGLTEVNGKYQLIDNERGITTYDARTMRNERDFPYGRGPVVENATTNFPKYAANEVHWGLASTYDYYKEIHNRLSYDGNGAAIKAYYDPKFLDNDVNSGLPENAYAMPVGRMSYLVFGRGGSFFNPLVNLDVSAHEFTHLVVDNNGNGGLDYQGESGALNEGFADIFGASVEHYAVNDPDWLIGNGVVKGSFMPFMRDMQNPKNNRQGGKQPNTYKGEHWANTSQWAGDNGGVHTNSGVINYWYYLVSEGGAGVNDLGNDYVVSGVGIKKAEKIAYASLMGGLSSNAQYIDVVEASKLIAADIYGAESEEYFTVYDAWYAVGFGERRPNMGVEDFELEEDVFSLYPNPVTNGELTVLTKDDKGVVTFYNMAGQKVTRDFAVEKGENKLSIPQLNTGNYIVVYESKERKISEKIVVR
ncbi:M4 family metallopeptidase [Myroides fluvii]|uniref:M4 family metallopeptidase n=1 Tax=Myroides fluvii TaxID=2572594 RepID=UPI00131B7BB4|nr:M4 family metallopeptidase [Myroides fluvii]